MARKERGGVVLLLTHFIFLAAFILSLAIYTGIFNQYESVQNEIEYRKNFWLAEAGLECVFAQLRRPSFDEDGLNNCNLPSQLELELLSKSEDTYKVRAAVGNIQITRYLSIHRVPLYKVSWLEGSWSDFDESY